MFVGEDIILPHVNVLWEDTQTAVPSHFVREDDILPYIIFITQ